ncbi:L-threonylcarbamoyladenylate synthase [Candidatus Nomurabacteria bacterium]|nr:L-threonylcarbamoyladenylate synthase [Candidatus Nomurabacteria bacterium]
MDWSDEKTILKLKNGGVAVMPTDTLYGIVGSALGKDTVERIYKIRKRSPEKPCIILIANLDELEKFGIIPTFEQQKTLARTVLASVEPISFVLDCADESFEYLHRGAKTLAFRIPGNKSLQELLKKTGPLIAPSANTEASAPAKNIKEARKYFGNLVDIYVDVGEITGKASKVIRLHKNGSIDIIRY